MVVVWQWPFCDERRRSSDSAVEDYSKYLKTRWRLMVDLCYAELELLLDGYSEMSAAAAALLETTDWMAVGTWSS